MTDRKDIIEATAVGRPEMMRAIDEQRSTIERISAIALNPDVSVDKMTALLDFRDRLEATAARKAFDLAISLAKAEMPPILKDGRAGFDSKSGGSRTEYQYETLAQIARTIDPILGKYGLSYRFRITQDVTLNVTCILSHRDGHAEETTLKGPAADQSGSKNPYQGIGSGVTFLERYTLKASLGLASERDDDGQAAGREDTISADQFRTLKAMLDEAGTDDRKLSAIYGIEDLHELPARLFDPARQLLLQRKAKASG